MEKIIEQTSELVKWKRLELVKWKRSEFHQSFKKDRKVSDWPADHRMVQWTPVNQFLIAFFQGLRLDIISSSVSLDPLIVSSSAKPEPISVVA